MINTSNSKLHNNATRTRDSATLLLMDVVMFCAFEKIQEPMWAGCWEKRLVCGRKELV